MTPSPGPAAPPGRATPNAFADSAADQARASRLARMRGIALLLLLLCVLALLLARAFQPGRPWLAWVAAFAEAAIVGALADWYAVTVLFRHPLGLKLPHTAIVPANQERIADNLAAFLESHFLASAPIAQRLASVNMAQSVARWLRDPARTAPLVDEIARLLPPVLQALDDSGLRAVLARAARRRVLRMDWPSLAARLLETITHEDRHQTLLDDLLAALHRLMDNEQAVEAMRARIHDELPALFNAFRADAYLLRRLLASAGALLDDAQQDRNHPLRREFDDFVRRFVVQLRESPAHRARVSAIVREGLSRPELAALLDELWRRMQAWLLADVERGADSVLRARLGELLGHLGERLEADASLRERVDRGLREGLVAVVERQRGRISAFVAEQVKSWDADALSRRIELNIGTDLQYIRVNGTIVGGLIGVAMHGLTRMAT